MAHVRRVRVELGQGGNRCDAEEDGGEAAEGQSYKDEAGEMMKRF